MASLDPIIRMNENMFRAPEKMHSKAGRKPLGDVTNSSKPLARDKSSAKAFTGFNKVQEKVPTKTGRKPLGDLTNSNVPRANEKTSKKNRVEHLSVVDEEQNFSWVKQEGFLHNHSECIKSQKKSTTMSLDYFLETVALKRESAPEFTSRISTDSEPEIADRFADLEMLDVCPPTPPALKSPSTPGSPVSPSWDMDWGNLELSPLKLRDSPTRN